MADWKQITARIRRAKGSKDPASQLSNLFQKTRDAMVAFELARYFESASKPEEAAKWYALSWQRFRRSDWKTKAQDAVTRLGGTLPADGEALAIPEIPQLEAQESPPASSAPDPDIPAEESRQTEAEAESNASPVAVSSDSAERRAAVPASHEKRGRRRGRRGGLNRPKGSSASAAPSASPPITQAHTNSAPHAEVAPPRVVDSRAIPRVPVETLPDSSSAVPTGVKGRFGDPGLSSRLSLLEMQFRRLLTCPPVKPDQADRAPAGPGVFVLTDEEMSTYYYVEACDSLRVAIGNVSRGGSARRSGISIKPLLADHLGIPEARVGKYLTEHCVVRWLQLDEGAEYFAHFVIAILHPILNAQS